MGLLLPNYFLSLNLGHEYAVGKRVNQGEVIGSQFLAVNSQLGLIGNR
jgi:hypothetical protein